MWPALASKGAKRYDIVTRPPKKENKSDATVAHKFGKILWEEA